MEIVAVPAFTDNYLWLVHDEESGATAVVDPGDGASVLAGAKQRGWTITQVWNTHWHPDHTGGNLVIKAATGASIFGPQNENIPGRDIALKEGDEVRLGQRIGIIRLGSQVDVVIPQRRDLCVLVSEGDRVSAGSSVIATVGVTPVGAGLSSRTAAMSGSV